MQLPYIVLSITGQAMDIVTPWVEKHSAAYPILCKAQNRAYAKESGGIPHSYLIGADGKVLWSGHPAEINDETIEGYLKDVKKADRVSTWAFTLKQQLAEMPDSMKGVEKLLVGMKFGAALKKAEGVLAKLEGGERDAGEAVCEWIRKSAESKMEKAGGSGWTSPKT